MHVVLHRASAVDGGGTARRHGWTGKVLLTRTLRLLFGKPLHQSADSHIMANVMH